MHSAGERQPGGRTGELSPLFPSSRILPRYSLHNLCLLMAAVSSRRLKGSDLCPALPRRLPGEHGFTSLQTTSGHLDTGDLCVCHTQIIPGGEPEQAVRCAGTSSPEGGAMNEASHALSLKPSSWSSNGLKCREAC